jgi:hypothetical protein
MIIADENIFDIIIEALEREGYEVLSIKHSSLRGISDYDISGLSLIRRELSLPKIKILATLFF